jgi:hypothetical protein
MLHTKIRGGEFVAASLVSGEKATCTQETSLGTDRTGRTAMTHNSDEHAELVSFARNLRRVKRRLFLLSVAQEPVTISST